MAFDHKLLHPDDSANDVGEVFLVFIIETQIQMSGQPHHDTSKYGI